MLANDEEQNQRNRQASTFGDIQKSSPKRETKQSNVITLISATNEKSTENNNKPNEGMKRILEENKHKKFLERKHELLK